MKKIKNFGWPGLFLLLLIILYLWSRLWHLTILPVFADEAIYIYWSQLIISDWKQYLFFPLNDGKTPLFIWLMIPLLKIWADPLLAGRLLSVVFGLGQLWLMYLLMKFFTSKKLYQLLALVLIIFSPGFILNQRLALMDTQLTFFLTSTYYFTLIALKRFFHSHHRQLPTIYKKIFWPFCGASLSFALALMTKISALLFTPILFFTLFYFYPPQKFKLTKNKIKRAFLALLILILIFMIGLGGLYFFKISASFSQLFSRGGDFLFSWSEFEIDWNEILSKNISLFGRIISYYLTLPLALFVFLLLPFSYRFSRQPLSLCLSGLLFLLPMLLLGKIIYPRYLLPALPFFILSFSLSLSYLTGKNFRLFKLLLMFLIILIGGDFIFSSCLRPEKMLLDPIDKEQYLQEWSSGYGILPAVEFLTEISKEQKTLVITEGHIGTLPDGLQIYFYQHPSRNQLRIEGVGQAIVDDSGINKLAKITKQYEQVVIVVNSHRLQLNLPTERLLREFKRPLANDPSLQIWQWKP